MANAILNGKHSYDITPEVDDNCTYYVATKDGDGMLIPGTELSDGFARPSAAFSALEVILLSHPNAGVFWRPMAA